MDNTKSVVVSTIINNVDDSFIRALLDRIPVDVIFDAIVDMSQQKDEQQSSYDRFATILYRYFNRTQNNGFVTYIFDHLSNIVEFQIRTSAGVSAKVTAIKYIREETGLNLRHAVDLINDCIVEFGWEFA